MAQAGRLLHLKEALPCGPSYALNTEKHHDSLMKVNLNRFVRYWLFLSYRRTGTSLKTVDAPLQCDTVRDQVGQVCSNVCHFDIRP
jgi:hypothetical protein